MFVFLRVVLFEKKGLQRITALFNNVIVLFEIFITFVVLFY